MIFVSSFCSTVLL